MPDNPVLIVSAKRLLPNETPEIVLLASMALVTVPVSALPTNVPLVGNASVVAAVTEIDVANTPLAAPLPRFVPTAAAVNKLPTVYVTPPVPAISFH